MSTRRVSIRGMSSLLLALLGTAAPAWSQTKLLVAPARQFTWQELVAQEAAAPPAVVPRGDNPRTEGPRRRLIPAEALLGAAPTTTALDILPLGEPCPGFPAHPAHGISFQGLDDNGAAWPPDTMGAVGPRHVMTMLNTQVRIQNRIGSRTYSTVTLTTFWEGLTGPFDPKIYYDQLSSRWIAVALGNKKSAASHWEIIVSRTDDPTGEWYSYHFDADGADTRWADFPCVGFNDKWVAVTCNMAAVEGVVPVPATGSKLWVLNKPEMLAAGSMSAATFDIGFDGINGNTLQPAVCLDANVPDLFIVDNSGWEAADQTNYLRISRLTGTAGAPQWSALPGSSVADKPGFFAVANKFSNTLVAGAQSGSPTPLDAGDTRLCNVVFRNGRIWTVHAGGWPHDTPDRNAIFWYEFQPVLPTPIVQSGFHHSGGPGGGYTYPSIAVNCGNDVCIGFASMSPSIFASGAYVVRNAADAPGTTGGTLYLRDGRAAYVKNDSNTPPRNRWGDYSATVVDPLDSLTFWTLQEYAELPSGGSSRWAVQWGQISHGCQPLVITQQPMTHDGCLGDETTFSILLQETRIADYQWYHNGQPIDGANQWYLKLTNLTPADAGQYTVTVMGVCSFINSAPATLNIVTTATLENPAFYSSGRCPGQNANIIPPVVSGAGPITHQLQRLVNGQWVDVPGRVIVPGDDFLLTNLQRVDTGDYRVAVINPCGAVYSNAGRIQVGVSFDQHPASLNRSPCEAAAFSVVARGVGGLAYQWRRNGVAVGNDDHITGANTAVLNIMGARYDDEGTYDCVVTDNCGPITSASATLTLPTPIWVQRVLDKPLKRGWIGMAYDAQRRVSVQYGGYGAGGYANETWEYDGVEWIQRTPPHNPGKRSNLAMCYDSDRGRIYLWGGFGGELPPISGWLGDLWSYDGNDWTLLNNSLPAYGSPYPATTPELAYDRARKKVVLVRNIATAQSESETWEYDPATNQWSKTVAANGFPAGYGGALTFDAKQGVCLHYLAYSGGFPDKQTWRYNGSSWQRDLVTTPQLPFTNMAYDSLRQRTVIFGANYGSTSYYTHSYYHTGTDWAVLLNPGPPESPPNWTALPTAMAYDSHRRAMVALLANYYSPADGPFETWEYRYIDRVVIDRQPQHQPLNPGMIATFSVQAVGYGPLSYQWKRSGTNLVDGPSVGGGVISGATTAVLTINPTGSADEGGYVVEVSNGCGQVLSNTAFLGTVPDVAGDLDRDGDVDRADLDALHICLLGPAIVQNAAACAQADLDGDHDVDQADFGILQRCFSGENGPVVPDCRN